jgi:hypothetical protein
MATDFSEKEREFIDSLEADTGRSLAAWMSAIAGQNLVHRNDIIDWLRRQGFLFSKASWLERIHHNGGRPIYSGTSSPQPNTGSSPPDPTADLLQPPPSASPALDIVTPQPRLMIVPAAGPSAVPSSAAGLDALLAHAKAYKPLAQYVLREIATAVPAAAFSAREGYVGGPRVRNSDRIPARTAPRPRAWQPTRPRPSHQGPLSQAPSAGSRRDHAYGYPYGRAPGDRRAAGRDCGRSGP